MGTFSEWRQSCRRFLKIRHKKTRKEAEESIPGFLNETSFHEEY